MAQAIDCHEAVKKLLKRNEGVPLDEVQYKLLKQTQKLEKRTNKLRIKKTNSEPAINLQIYKKIAKYDAMIENNSYSQVTREIRPLFREVESAVTIIDRYEKVIEVLNTRAIFDDFDVLRTELNTKGIHEELVDAVIDRLKISSNSADAIKYYKSVIDENAIHLGHFYHEYKLIRHHLEDLLEESNCDELCRTNVKRLLDSVGVESFTDQERYYALLKGGKRPSWAELNRSLNSHPLAYTTRLKRERDEEFKMFWKGLFYEVLPIDDIANAILRIPGLNKTKVIRLIKLVYDRIARLVHFPKINRVVRSPQDTASKFDLFVNLNTTIVPEDEMMISFARRIDSKTKDTWQELFDYAQQNQERFPDMLERMTKAKEKAMARGEISLVHEKSFTTKLAIVLTAGGSIAYYYFNKKEVEEVIEDINENNEGDIPELQPTKAEEEDFELDGKAMSIKLNSDEDTEMNRIVDEVIELTTDIKIPDRVPNSKKVSIEPLRFIKEI